MLAIIFGANGQDGFYLKSLLEQKGIVVVGVSRSGNFLRTDISDFDQVSELIKSKRPDYIFHLAANSTTNHAAMFENHQTISTGTLNILESVKNYSPTTKVFISGSGLQFKNENKSIKETDLFEARDAYAVSRIQSVFAARYFRTVFNLKVYVGYFFNHDSPLRSERHIAKKVSETAKRIQAGSNEKLLIGDVSVSKEWTFAGDVVEGIWLLVSQDKVFEANISSGLGYSIEEWVAACFKLIEKDYRDYLEVVPNYTSPYRQLISDACIIKSLGFKPKVTFNTLAKMMMEND